MGNGLAKTVAIFNGGKFEDNIEYYLKDTLCNDVVGREVCCFSKNVRHLFPSDIILLELKAESYIGTTLWSFNRLPIGLIAVIGRKPLENPHLAETLLKIVAVRAAGEMERKQVEISLKESNKQLEETLTKLKDSQKQILQQERLRSLGQLVSGIAHDINNSLTPIMGYIDLLADDKILM